VQNRSCWTLFDTS